MATLPIFATLEPLERILRFTPLGIRFWDPAAGVPVVDGLEVLAMPPDRPDLARRAARTPAGIYAFHSLPGLSALEFPDPNTPPGEHPPDSPPVTQRFLIYVRDAFGRFSPCLFFIDAPYRGIFPLQPAGSPAQSLPGFYLFSAPTRTPLATLGVVRAQIVERTTSGQARPAAFAILEVEPPSGPVWPGIANADGSAVVFLPQPTFTPPPPQTSPLTPPPSPSRFITWDLTIRVRYASPGLEPLAGFPVPTLSTVLSQPFAQLYTSLAGPGQLSNQIVSPFTFGQPLLVQTAGRSELWIEG